MFISRGELNNLKARVSRLEIELQEFQKHKLPEIDKIKDALESATSIHKKLVAEARDQILKGVLNKFVEKCWNDDLVSQLIEKTILIYNRTNEIKSRNRKNRKANKTR